jgi:hypothetical protein
VRSSLLTNDFISHLFARSAFALNNGRSRDGCTRLAAPYWKLRQMRPAKSGQALPAVR